MLEIIRGHTLLIGVLVVGGFCIWKFIIQPILNEGEPIEPKEEEEKSMFEPVNF